MSVASKLSKKSKEVIERYSKAEPVWAGPESDADNGGITFSLLTKFMEDPERFRLHAIQGVKLKDSFNHKIEYGNFLHICEEHKDSPRVCHKTVWMDRWECELGKYRDKLCLKYPNQREEINKWHDVCEIQFPIYLNYWKSHPDMLARKHLFSEQTFCVPHLLPSGRTIYLRGKWDSGDLVGKNKPKVFLQENKAKGRVDVLQLQRQLTFDAQTMIYVVALSNKLKDMTNAPFGGVRYNVVRRPLTQGNKGCITRHKATKTKPEESLACFHDRLSAIITTEADYYFIRWNVEIAPYEILAFRRTFLDPTLERLCDWYSWVTKTKDPFSPYDGCENSVGGSVSSWVHYRAAFGMYNSLTDGKGSTDLDYHLQTGSMVGLEHVSELFPELKV